MNTQKCTPVKIAVVHNAIEVFMPEKNDSLLANIPKAIAL